MQSSQIALTFGVILVIMGGMIAVLAGLGAAWWGWAGAILWALLWLTAASGLTDPASRRFLAGAVKNLGFGKIYGTLARRNVMRLWERYCMPASDTAPIFRLLLAALSGRLLVAAFWLAVGYLLLILLGQWAITALSGDAGVTRLLGAIFTVEDGKGVILVALAGLLLILNTFFDFISSALTLALMRRSLRARLPLLWWLLDFVLSGVIFLLLGASIMAAISALTLRTDLAIIDLAGLSAGLVDAPGAYPWLWLMLITPMVPTALHAALAVLGVQGLWPRGLRRPVAGWIERADQGSVQALRASFGLSIIWTLPLLLLTFGGWLLWVLTQPLLLDAFQLYLDALSAAVAP